MGGSKVTAGFRFGKIEVLKPTEDRDVHGRILWQCRCDCGNECLAAAAELISGYRDSCGCVSRLQQKDFVGKRFGRLIVSDYAGKPKNQHVWKCLCDCGNETMVGQSDLLSGNTISCGCVKREHMSTISESLTFVGDTCIEWLQSRKSRADSGSGFRGVHKTQKGYSVEISLQKKRYYVGHFKDIEDAITARLKVEELLHVGFINAYKFWQEKADSDPGWAEENPFFFTVKKDAGVFYTHSPLGLDHVVVK